MELLETAKKRFSVRSYTDQKVEPEKLNKILEAATEQQSAIEALAKSGRLERLPEKLQQTAQLRLEHPELSLAQLAELCDPPVSKSCMNHRMRKLNEEAKKLL